jgi:hypothetical protein
MSYSELFSPYEWLRVISQIAILERAKSTSPDFTLL